MELREQLTEPVESPWTGPSANVRTDLLQRGRAALELLERQTIAARLEAQLVQLRTAIARADNGESHYLELWLHQFDQDAGLLAAHGLSPEPITVTSTVMPESSASQATSTIELDNSAFPCDGWATYLPHARQRLAELNRSALPWDDAEPTNGHQLDDQLASDTVSTHSWTEESIKLDALRLAPCELGAVESETILHETILSETDEDETDGNASAQLDLRALLALGQVAEQLVDEGQPKKRLWGSFTFSLIGHAILFAVLGTITYQHERDQVASLGTQVLSAVEAPVEQPDLGAQLELIQPEDTNLESFAGLSSTAPSTELASLSTAGLNTIELSEATGSRSPASAIAAALGGIGGGKSSPGQGRSSGRGGGAPKLGGQFFGVDSGGNYFCYVVDSSGSMRGEAWSSAKKELVRSLLTLQPTQQFYIIFFASEMHAIPEPGSNRPATHGLLATSDNIHHARRWIETVKLSLGGPPTDALAWAIEREPDAIYLLTDGVTKVDVCSFVRKINQTEDLISGPQIRVPIHPIAYHSLAGQQLMRQLAEENNGRFHYVPAK